MAVPQARVLVATLAAVAVGLAGCSDATPGNAQPGTETTSDRSTSGTKPTTKTGSTTSRSGNSPLVDTEPCSLLSADGATQLGLPARGEKHDVGSARGCRWQVKNSSTTRGFGVDVGIRDEAGLKDLPTDNRIKKIPNVGSHEAVQTTELGGTGTCAIIMGVTDSSRVETGAVVGGDTQKACELAMQVAKLVEPKLRS